MYPFCQKDIHLPKWISIYQNDIYLPKCHWRSTLSMWFLWCLKKLWCNIWYRFLWISSKCRRVSEAFQTTFFCSYRIQLVLMELEKNFARFLHQKYTIAFHMIFRLCNLSCHQVKRNTLPMSSSSHIRCVSNLEIVVELCLLFFQL